MYYKSLSGSQWYMEHVAILRPPGPHREQQTDEKTGELTGFRAEKEGYDAEYVKTTVYSTYDLMDSMDPYTWVNTHSSVNTVEMNYFKMNLHFYAQKGYHYFFLNVQRHLIAHVL
jgi:hypothetical protein